MVLKKITDGFEERTTSVNLEKIHWSNNVTPFVDKYFQYIKASCNSKDEQNLDEKNLDEKSLVGWDGVTGLNLGG